MKLLYDKSIVHSLTSDELKDGELIFTQGNEPLEPLNKDDIDVYVTPVESGGEFCDSCYLNYNPADFFALTCGHRFCINCNREHLQTKINDGNAMRLPCMQF